MAAIDPYAFRDEQGNLSIYNMRKNFETAPRKSGIIHFHFEGLQDSRQTPGVNMRWMQYGGRCTEPVIDF